MDVLCINSFTNSFQGWCEDACLKEKPTFLDRRRNTFTFFNIMKDVHVNKVLDMQTSQHHNNYHKEVVEGMKVGGLNSVTSGSCRPTYPFLDMINRNVGVKGKKHFVPFSDDKVKILTREAAF